MAGSQLDTENVSPFDISIDSGPAIDVRGLPGTGKAYGPDFIWSDVAPVTLEAGVHTLEVMVTGTRPADDRYVLNIDSILITRAPFVPDGTNRPVIDTLALDGAKLTPIDVPTFPLNSTKKKK
jgi:hypothetical protein